VCRHLAIQVASPSIACRHSNFADAARRWVGEESGGAGELWFSTVLGLEGSTGPLKCVYALFHTTVIIHKQAFGGAGCSATPGRAS